MSENVVIDPVCGMRVDPAHAADKREYQSATFYFCSAWCAQRFDDDADAYITASRLRREHEVERDEDWEDPHP